MSVVTWDHVGTDLTDGVTDGVTHDDPSLTDGVTDDPSDDDPSQTVLGLLERLREAAPCADLARLRLLLAALDRVCVSDGQSDGATESDRVSDHVRQQLLLLRVTALCLEFLALDAVSPQPALT
ncbi:MAG: hypothetical protein MHM6MM_009567, partial [Cercozoa sp. M6MM]